MTVRIIHADVMEGLAQLDSDSVHCCVTSPPYWGLRCYGTDGQLGLEPTLAEHIDKLVEVFEEVRRVLRPDGVCFLNYGDAYATRHFTRQGNPRNVTQAPNDWKETNLRRRRGDHVRVVQQMPEPALKPKDNCLIPERLAIALQEAGWWVRDRIVWHKPNPMPSSVTDRCTPSYELVYMLTKRGRYWWDAEAIKEPVTGNAHARRKDGERVPAKGTEQNDKRTGTWKETYVPTSRNCRNVWEIGTFPMPEAHFATFPPELVRRCLLAACPEKVCASCGAGWVREVERETVNCSNAAKAGTQIHGKGHPTPQVREDHDIRNGPTSITRTLGWSPSCTCQAETRPGTCLDPFGGSGTVGLVADRMKRNAILIELSKEYCDMAEKRIQGDAPLFVEIESA